MLPWNPTPAAPLRAGSCAQNAQRWGTGSSEKSKSKSNGSGQGCPLYTNIGGELRLAPGLV